MPDGEKGTGRRRAWHILKLSVMLGGRSGLHTARELLIVMVPVIVIMTALEALGFLPWIARSFAPAMRILGLPGDAALVFLSAAFVNLYSAIAVAANIALTAKQVTVLAILCLVCHNLPVECAVQKKAGTGVWPMLAVRVLTGFAAAFAFHWLIPESADWTKLLERAPVPVAEALSTWQFLQQRALANALFLVKVVLIIMALMVLMELLRQTGALRLLTVLMRPLTWLAGLPAGTGFTVMTSMTIGLAFGAGTVIAEARQGYLSKEEQFRTNVFIGTTHSLFEDTMLFVIIGASLVWIVLGRLIIGCISVRLFGLARRLYLGKLGKVSEK